MGCVVSGGCFKNKNKRAKTDGSVPIIKIKDTLQQQEFFKIHSDQVLIIHHNSS